MRNFIIKGDICHSISPAKLQTVKDGYLVCEDGVSKGVYEVLSEQHKGYPLIDCSGKLVVPGLVDLHMHAPQYTYRALGMDKELLDWLNSYTFPEEAKYSDLEYAEFAYRIMADDLVKGPNTRSVMFATIHSTATELLMDIMDKTGLVSYVGKVNMDRNAPGYLIEKSAATSLADTQDWIESTRSKHERTMPILTPRFIPTCSDALMQGLAQLQQDCRLPLQSHLSENHGEIAWVKALCPDSANYADAYYRSGALHGLPTIMAHCVWCDDDEIERLKESGAYVAHCPQSNLNIASGIAPMRRYMRHGLNVGLGSDIAGGAHPSIFRAMTDAIGVSKLWWRLMDQHDEPLTLNEAFHMATRGGGSFFGKVGAFDDGYELDALIIDDSNMKTPRALTIEDRLARVAHLSDDRHIVGKFVRGKRLF